MQVSCVLYFVDCAGLDCGFVCPKPYGTLPMICRNHSHVTGAQPRVFNESSHLGLQSRLFLHTGRVAEEPFWPVPDTMSRVTLLKMQAGASFGKTTKTVDPP